MYWTDELIPKLIEHFLKEGRDIYMLQSVVDSLVDSSYLLEQLDDEG